MTSHQSSAVSLAVVATAGTVLVAGYRAVRAHAGWRDPHGGGRRPVRATRRDVLSETVGFVTAAVLILGTLFVAAYIAAS
jgi:hypothetical protein